MAGRPSSFTQEMADAICEDLMSGLSLRRACQSSGRPDVGTVLRWVSTNDLFREQYARAREVQTEGYADEIIEITDTEEDPARARVRMDARKWVAAKLLPKKYGERSTTHLVGKDDDSPIETKDITNLERAKALAALVSAAKASE